MLEVAWDKHFIESRGRRDRLHGVQDGADVALIAFKRREGGHVVDLHEEASHGSQLGVEFAGKPAHEAEEEGERISLVCPERQEEAAVAEVLRVRCRVAFAVDYRALWKIKTLTLGYEDLSSSDDAGGEVDDEGGVIAGGDAYCDGVCAQGAAGAAEGDYLRPCCRGATQGNQRDAAGPGGLFGVFADAADVGCVLEGDAADGGLSGSFYSPVHGLAAHRVAESPFAVDMHRVGALADDFGVGLVVDVAVFDPVKVHGHELDAVGVVAGEVGVDEDFGDGGGDVVRGSGGGEEIAADPLQVVS